MSDRPCPCPQCALGPRASLFAAMREDEEMRNLSLMREAPAVNQFQLDRMLNGIPFGPEEPKMSRREDE